MIKLKVDEVGHVAYLYMTETAPRKATKQIKCDGPRGGTIVLDFNDQGHLIGVEFIGIKLLLPPEYVSRDGCDSGV